MLTLLLGKDWVNNRDEILRLIANNVSNEIPGNILIVPELISHETERRLCAAAGNTVSRFAEVLTFTGLARRVAEKLGHGAVDCLDNGGRIVAMASAVQQVHSKLKAYASVETKPEFLNELVNAMDEFKRCCIDSKTLSKASSNAEGNLAQKLEELSLILECYEALCQQGKRDPRDQMIWLLEELRDSDYAQRHTFFIDGFPDFTIQHMQILEHLIAESANVIVSLNCDCLDSQILAFEKAGSTAGELLRIAKKLNVPVDVKYVEPSEGKLQEVCAKLFQGKLEEGSVSDVLRVYRTSSIYDECVVTAENIVALIKSGVRYRKISVVCADMAIYRNTIESVFSRFNIPTYLTGMESVLEKTVIEALLNAMDAALGGFEQNDVLNYIKSILSPLDFDICDKIENYVHMWGIQGNRWLVDWTGHPEGFSEKWSDEQITLLADINIARNLAMGPLIKLREGLISAKNVRGQVCSLYAFFEDIHLSEKLSKLAEQLEIGNDGRNAQIFNQLWEILLNALEQLYDVLGNTYWDSEAFVRLFKLLLSQYNVGTIPSVLDAVSVGSVSTMRCQKTDYLFILGAVEGCFPKYSGSTGVLTDQERVQLRNMGVPLTGGSIDGLKAEFAEIYGTVCAAQKFVTVSYPSGQPSFIYRRLKDLAGGESNVSSLAGAAMRDPYEAGIFLAAGFAENEAKVLGLDGVYKRICEQWQHGYGRLNIELVKRLYGDELLLSASQIDCQAQCRFSYFMKYGLRAKEQKEAKVDPAEFGTYVHAVLESTVRDIMKEGGFQQVSIDRTVMIAKHYSDEYLMRFAQIKNDRTEYLFKRNAKELEIIVREVWTELHNSSFEPAGFEVGFGKNGELPPINLEGKLMKAKLRGFIDRVDVWRDGEDIYFRIVDYKTGKKDFDYCDVFNGIGLQMLLYMFALEQGAIEIFDTEAIAAGVQYFPARVPLIPMNALPSGEAVSAGREKLWRRAGLLLADGKVLKAMSTDATENRMPYNVKKDGQIAGDIASRKQLDILKTYLFDFLGGMIDEIASGCVDANPYTRGSMHNACSYCPYGSVCRVNEKDRRNYKTMTAQRFWDETEMVVTKRG